MNEPTKRRRLDPAVRGEEIIQAALRLAKDGGYKLITREQIATEARCAPTLVSKYFGEMPEVREHIMRAAIDYKNLEVLIQGLITNDEIALAAPRVLKDQAFAKLENELNS